MKILSEDESGELVSGVFFDLSIPLDMDIELPSEELRSGWVCNRLPPTHPDRVPVYGNVGQECELLCECPLDSTHYSGTLWKDEDVQLCGGDVMGAFVCDIPSQNVLITRAFRDQLEQSGLTGFATSPLRVVLSQAQVKNPELFLLRLQGQMRERRLKLQIPEPNACPFCGWGPVVCPACQWVTHYCPRCDKYIVVLKKEHGGPDDKRFITDGLPDEGRIMEGHTWDGADFVKGPDQGLVSRRAVQWFLRVGAAPFIARPCRVDISRMSDEQLRLLERAKGSG